MLKHFFKKVVWLAVPALSMASTAYAVSDAELMKKGIWRDAKTGLMWDRCSVGQSWNGTTCTGQAIELNWQDAIDYVKQFTNQQAKGGYSDWRLPTIQELSSIRYCSKGWYQATETVSELTAQGRVTRQVATNHGTEMRTIPANKGGTIQVPWACADGSNKPTIIDTTIFPKTIDDFYWSSSPYANHYNHAWGVNFYNGNGSNNDKSHSYYVRAVRSD